MLQQSFKMAWKSISGSKMRSFLTMLGVIIGVIALVVLVSLVSGATDSVTSEISSLGNNLLTVSISNDKGNPIRLNELSNFTENDEIELVAPLGQFSGTAKNGYENTSTTVYGTTASYQQIQGLELEYGRFLKTADVDNSTYTAVISYELADELFNSSEVIGETLAIDGRNFTIVGVLKENDSMMSMMSSNTVYIPFTVASRMSQSGSNITTFYATSSNPDSMDNAETAMSNMMMERLRQDEDAYSIMNQSTIMSTLDSITGTLSLLLGGIAAISLLVGGIGIMNIMLVSVTERTREIGIRKAIGASKRSIMIQFITEALMLSLIGCLIGILLSWGILQVVSMVAGDTLSFSLSANVVLISVAFSTAIGVLFGSYPANKAANMNPIQALRYE